MLERLPAEIVGHIGSYLNQGDLMAFMLTNKWIYRHTKAQLYCTVVFDFDKIYKYKNKVGETVLTRLKSMNALLRCPNTDKIRSLKLSGYMIKNLSKSRAFKRFIISLRRFVYGSNRLVAFVNNSQIVNTHSSRAKALEQLVERFPIGSLQEYKFSTAENLIEADPSQLLHLSRVTMVLLSGAALDEANAVNLRNCMTDKTHIDLKIDKKMLQYLVQNSVVGVSARDVALELYDDITGKSDMELLFAVFSFRDTTALTINCNTSDDRILLGELLDMKNFKRLKIDSRIENNNKL